MDETSFKELRDYIETAIIPQYKEFDKAHNLTHVRSVINESMELAKSCEVDTAMVYTIAAYHDTGLRKDRKIHHIVSGMILKSDMQLHRWFNTAQIMIMKDAIEDHRASSKQIPRSIYGKIVAEADRLINPEITMRRAIQYGLGLSPSADREAHFERFNHHMLEKYAEGGYLKLWFEHSKNAEQLKGLRTIIADEEKLHKIFNRLFEEEIK